MNNQFIIHIKIISADNKICTGKNKTKLNDYPMEDDRELKI